MPNALMVIFPYKYHDMWVFDDEDVGLNKEPFISGADTVIDRAIEAGALAYLVKPFQRSELVPAVEIARARHREMRAITDQAQTLANRLEDRKTIDRARGVLMDEVGLSETDAFRFIQQAAMNERANMADVARQVLEDGRRPES